MAKTTSTDVAKMAGVSQSTVSAVLSNNTKIKISASTRKKVMDAAKELKYGPFSNPVHSIGLKEIAVFVPNMDNPYYPRLISYLEDILHENKMTMILCCTGNNPDKEYEQLMQFDTFGISGIIYAYTPTHYVTLKKLSDKQPVIIIGESDHEDIVTVALDSRKAGYLAAKYLYDLGHRKIAFVSGDMNAVSLSRQRRLEGMNQFVGEHKSEMFGIAVYTTEDKNSPRDDIGIGYTMTKKLLNRSNSNITAIVGVNDYTAVGILNAVRDSGLSAPESISVMGFDNIEMTRNISPTLTTVDHCIKERCIQAVEIVQSGSRTNRITYNPVIIENQSTGVPNSNE